jgi:hypothetical protein
MVDVMPRRISPEEAQVILAALRRAPRLAVADDLLETIPTLEVISRCECGCATVHFTEDLKGQQILANGIGTTARGGGVG